MNSTNPGWLDLTRDRSQVLIAAPSSALLTALFLLLPAFCHLRYNCLLWTEGFNGQLVMRNLLTGQYQKMIETPRPLWNALWILSPRPDRLLPLIALMFGCAVFLLQAISYQLGRSVLPGLAAACVLVFGVKDTLGLYLSGNWTAANVLLGLLFLYAALSERWLAAAVVATLMGLVRPENWILALLIVAYMLAGRRHLRWFHFLPAAAPLLWLLFDIRLNGDWLYSYRVTADYALLTGLEGATALNFWPSVKSGMLDVAGGVLLGYGVVGLLLRIVSRVRAAKSHHVRAVLLDPLPAVAILPLMTSWAMSFLGRIVVMTRFFYLSLFVLALFAMLAPLELARLIGRPRWSWFAMALALPALVIGFVRFPAVASSLRHSLAVAQCRVLDVKGLCATVREDTADLSQYRYVMIPARRYAQFSACLPENLARKLVSYREVSIAEKSARDVMEGHPPDVPVGSSSSVRQLLSGKLHLKDFLPALVLWVPDDEIHYMTAFALDKLDYHRKNYLIPDDSAGVIGFKLKADAIQGTGVIYDARPMSSDEMVLHRE